jgi:hypothetical protein
MNVWQMVRAAVLIRRSLGESTYPPNWQMTIAIAKIDGFYDKKRSWLKSKLGLSADIDVVHVLRSHDASRCHSLTQRGSERD